MYKLWRGIALSGGVLAPLLLLTPRLGVHRALAKGTDPASAPVPGAAVDSGGLMPLSMVPVPTAVGGDVVDQAAAVRLGKAFFWDVQAGGDGRVACATCHYQAGTDSRRKNVINPGPNNRWEAASGPGQIYNNVSLTSDDRVGSAGVVGSIFQSVSPDPAVAKDNCAPDESAPFNTNRRVTGRNTPQAIGAVFNRDNFWDGRANHTFNGVDPFGVPGTAAPTAPATGGGDSGGHGGRGAQTQVGNASVASAANGSLASQADGPPGSSTEMSCAGRNMNGPNSLGTKLLARYALHHQQVSPTDGVLGAYSMAPATGMRCGRTACTYRDLIAAAFGSAMAANAEAEFSRIWGQAILAYESTLIPSQTPMDRYLAGDASALTSSQKAGMGIFTGKGGCVHCHAGGELSDATLSFANSHGLLNEDGGDQGFHNLGVRPTAEDVGRAGSGPSGASFSMSGAIWDHGAFKTPMLRDVKLTAPYFHNGGKATLADVVDFYDRGGDFANPEKAKRLKPLSLSPGEKASLVDFLGGGLTDCRVEMNRAPFDHPSLIVPDGPNLPAVGAMGLGPCP